ncbi:ATP-grasp fold amidoligase family protein [Helicobacter sp. MIT 21-1697]|uniref:ATP-grasp fold amidoligase family protein n=1 Tax=Helicobacter sp. MIT 21-1697 TaxID=2993733 RepID=UPI00224B1A90|nr:ATP-grasp fold amidoligase family protein [Helicobacter sp. MIT 21-1697]MCX2717491.1 ATP-grasp fold amidoligase family protein [Helicobacter sp. MIT 21-1697]
MYKNIEDIDFNALPQSFVLKTNHDCGGVVLVPDKAIFLQDCKIYKQSLQKLTEHLQTNYYSLYREWHYKDIEPRIFAEEMLGMDMQDFRFHCFSGKIGFIQVANAAHTRNDLFDVSWNRLDISYLNAPSENPPLQPPQLKSMCAIAQKLSACFNYVRVDLYCVGEQVFVGELTFTPNGGSGKFNPHSYDETFGALWKNE